VTYSPARYLTWARTFYGRVPYDLATSGTLFATRADLGTPADLDDWEGIAGLRASIAHYNDVPEAEAIPALGTSHAVWLAYATLLSPGDEVLVEAPAGTVPDVRGLSARDAMRKLAKAGLSTQMTGDGYVVSQDPAPGEPIENRRVGHLTLQRVAFHAVSAGAQP
jgi:hypothetical protein